MESYGGVSSYENDWEVENSFEYDCFSDQQYENIIYKNENIIKAKKNQGNRRIQNINLNEH